jgi:thioesterase domain-containing protein
VVQPEGPYLLVGVCSGAARAFEIAQQLLGSGRRVALLALVEPTPPYARGFYSFVELAQLLGQALQRRLREPGRILSEIRTIASRRRNPYVRSKLDFLARFWSARSYVPKPYPGHVHAFVTRASLESRRGPRLEWRRLVARFDVHELTSNHYTMLQDPHAAQLAAGLDACIAAGLSSASAAA